MASPLGPEEQKGAFLHELEARGVLPSNVSSDDAATAVMCALAQRLTTGETHRMLLAMPDALRPFFVPCAEHRAGVPPARFDRTELLDAVAAHLAVTPAQAEWICRAVFRAVRAQLPEEHTRHVAQQLPAELKALWEDELVHGSVEMLDAAGVLRAIGETVALPAHRTPVDAFSAVVCTLADRLSGGEARKLFFALPEALRAHVQACVVNRGELPALFGRDELLARVARRLGTSDAIAGRVARGVFAAVKGAIPEKDVDDVASQLPPDLREFWLAAR
jgi:uncharacterized protein (DUF2267 family)